MKPKIEQPRVFISYAWGTDDYQNKVIEFAKSLVDNGIDVELDKWSLKEGNDTYSFMEQMVNNNDITNVLILLDQNYADKSNNHEGGVGTETQIISPEIYTKVKQEKFIPVIFTRGKDGTIYKPTFLKGLLHFDLSLDEKYNSEFQRLVRRLYGIEIIEKPPIGTQPDWLTKIESRPNIRFEFSKVFSSKDPREKRFELGKAFGLIKTLLTSEVADFQLNENNYIDSYKILQKYRKKVTSLVEGCLWDDCLPQELSSFLENTKNSEVGDYLNEEMKDTIIHEIFIYIVGILFTSNNYRALTYIVNKTFFDSSKGEGPTSFNLFYQHSQSLDNMVKRRDNKNYFCGTAQLWMETIDNDCLSKKAFVAADDLLYNIAVFGKNYIYNWWWFPVSYVYDDGNTIISDFGKKLVSKEHLLEASKLFGYQNGDDFVKSIKAKLEKYDKRYRHRYNGAWNDAPLIIDYFKIEDAGKYN